MTEDILQENNNSVGLVIAEQKEKKEIVKDRKQLTIYIPDELYRVIKVIVTLRKTNISREVKLFLEGFARENKPLIYKMFPQKKQNKIDGR